MDLPRILIPIRVVDTPGIESFKFLFPEMVKVAYHEDSGTEIYLTENHKGLNILIPLDAFTSNSVPNPESSDYDDVYVTTCSVFGYPIGIDSDQRRSFTFCLQTAEKFLYKRSQESVLQGYLNSKGFKISLWAACKPGIFENREAVMVHLV